MGNFTIIETTREPTYSINNIELCVREVFSMYAYLFVEYNGCVLDINECLILFPSDLEKRERKRYTKRGFRTIDKHFKEIN